MRDEETEFKLTPENIELLKLCAYLDRRDYEKRSLLKSMMTTVGEMNLADCLVLLLGVNQSLRSNPMRFCIKCGHTMEHDYLKVGWVCPYCGHKE